MLCLFSHCLDCQLVLCVIHSTMGSQPEMGQAYVAMLCPQWKNMEGGLEAMGPDVAARQRQSHKLCQDLPGRQRDLGWKDPLQESHDLRRFPLQLS